MLLLLRDMQNKDKLMYFVYKVDIRSNKNIATDIFIDRKEAEKCLHEHIKAETDKFIKWDMMRVTLELAKWWVDYWNEQMKD